MLSSSQTQQDPTIPPGLTPDQQRRLIQYRALRAQGLDHATAKAAIQAPTMGPATGPSGPRTFMDKAKVTGKAALQGLGDFTGMLGTALEGGPLATIPAQLATNNANVQGLVNRVAPGGEPRTQGEAYLAAGTRGATGGAPFGPVGAVSGMASGLGGELAAQHGASPETQMIVSLLAGAVPAAGGAMIAGRNPMTRAGQFAERTLAANEQPGLRTMGTPAPGVTAQERLGGAGQSMALRTASEGGKGGQAIVQHAKSVLEDAPARFERQVLESFKANPNGPKQITGGVDETYQPLVNALYDQARKETVQITPEIADLLTSSPQVRQAYRLRAKAYNVGKKPDDRIPLDLMENGQLRSALPVAALDEIKRGFDLVAGGKPGSGAKAAADFDAALLPLVDQQTKVYPIARSVAREQINLRQASEYVMASPEKAKGMEGDLATFFSPDDLARLKLIRDYAQQTTKRAGRVVQAGEPKPAPGKNNPIKKLIADFITGTRRTIAQGASEVAVTGSDLPPEVRQVIAQFLASTGRNAGQQADALATAATQPGRVAVRGISGTGVVSTKDR